MTLTHTRQQSLAAERVAVRVVDSDVHPVPRQGVLADYIPEPWRSKFFLSRPVGEQHLLRRAGLRTLLRDAGRHASPPDGEFAGSDPEMAFRQVIIEAGVDIAILGAASTAFTRLPEATAATVAIATNRLAGRSLAGQPQQLARAVARVHLRRRSSSRRPAVREIERVGRTSLHGADPDRRRAATLMGRSALRPHLGGRHQTRHHRSLPPRPW